MRRQLFFLSLICMSPFSLKQFYIQPPSTILSLKTIEDIAAPAGYERMKVSNESFSFFLRQQQLKKNKTVYLYNGKPKANQTAQYAVLNISTGNKDLQQCADAVMRLRAEYLKNKNEVICFKDNDNKKYIWNHSKYKDWQHYLETVFSMCGTLSLQKQLVEQSWDQLSIGDVLIKGGSPGHAVIIMDVAKHCQTGEKIFLLAQSYMPAQDIHVLQNLYTTELNPWFKVTKDKMIYTPEWTFYANQLRKW